MHVLSRTKRSVTFVVSGRKCTVTREEYARIVTRVHAAESARQASNREVRELMRETAPGRMQAMVEAPGALDLSPAEKAADRFGLNVGTAQPARVGFGQSDAAYAPAVTGIRRPNVGRTESSLTGRSVSLSVNLPIRKA